MTLLASVASLFCSFSVSAAAPAVAVVPAQSVNRVEIISPIVEDQTAIDSESLTANEEARVADLADFADEVTDLTPDKVALASNNDALLPADVILDDELLLPADVIVDGEELLPADVIADIEADLLLPADVIADIEADVIADAEAESAALAEANAGTAPLFEDDIAEDPAPTPAAAEEPAGSDDPIDASGDGEAAS
jgi:hypothetical protein